MGTFDTMQVCLNGHQITDTYYRYPQHRKKHCPNCGAKTIHQCPKCNSLIKGNYHVENFIDLSGRKTPVPKVCEDCGVNFPWNNKKIQLPKVLSSIIVLYKQAVDNVPILKYSWVIVATICLLALAGYFKLNNSDVFVYPFFVLVISFFAFVFSLLLKTEDRFIKIILYIFITCLIITIATAVLGFASYILFKEPVFYERLFPKN
ncbi:DUF2321 domain-containing protein [uncultured Flavobacterium sp.]|uniref:DUF2321 domain-containing protein n=1 Tax=uncultured Flavobacterium sp. TaxID=165435 RepID=UPI003082028B